MEIRAHFKDARYNLASYKMRSALAVIGILVGTASVVAMVLCAQLATEKALAQFKPLGTNLMAVTMWTRGESNDSAIELSIDEALAMSHLHDDIKKLHQFCPELFLLKFFPTESSYYSESAEVFLHNRCDNSVLFSDCLPHGAYSSAKV